MMERKVMRLLLVVLAFVVLGISTVQAQGPAVVILDGLCALPDANGNPFLTTETHQVFANDANGNSKITCHATQPASVPNPSKAVHFNYANTGMYCDTGWGITQDWKAVVTPSGKVMLSCHINPNPTP